jgi:cell division protein FtsB
MVSQVQVLELIILFTVIVGLVVGFGVLLLNQRGQIERLRAELQVEREERKREREDSLREKAELKKQIDLLRETIIGLRDPNSDALLAK